jgi:hypothetical protein
MLRRCAFRIEANSRDIWELLTDYIIAASADFNPISQ